MGGREWGEGVQTALKNTSVLVPTVARDHAQASIVGPRFDRPATATATTQAPGHCRRRRAAIHPPQQIPHRQHPVMAAIQTPSRHGYILACQFTQSRAGFVEHERINHTK